MKNHKLTKEELFKIMHACLSHYLSEEELYDFILDVYFKKEGRINKQMQQ